MHAEGVLQGILRDMPHLTDGNYYDQHTAHSPQEVAGFNNQRMVEGLLAACA
jgi:hypothetical protein